MTRLELILMQDKDVFKESLLDLTVESMTKKCLEHSEIESTNFSENGADFVSLSIKLNTDFDINLKEDIYTKNFIEEIESNRYEISVSLDEHKAKILAMYLISVFDIKF